MWGLCSLDSPSVRSFELAQRKVRRTKDGNHDDDQPVVAERCDRLTATRPKAQVRALCESPLIGDGQNSLAPGVSRNNLAAPANTGRRFGLSVLYDIDIGRRRSEPMISCRRQADKWW